MSKAQELIAAIVQTVETARELGVTFEALEDLEELAASMETECPNHGGGFDCNPFCAICEGNQYFIDESTNN